METGGDNFSVEGGDVCNERPRVGGITGREMRREREASEEGEEEEGEEGKEEKEFEMKIPTTL
jgi:hypothetical protein